MKSNHQMLAATLQQSNIAGWKMGAPYWVDVFPIENRDIPGSYVGLPEGRNQSEIKWFLLAYQLQLHACHRHNGIDYVVSWGNPEMESNFFGGSFVEQGSPNFWLSTRITFWWSCSSVVSNLNCLFSFIFTPTLWKISIWSNTSSFQAALNQPPLPFLRWLIVSKFKIQQIEVKNFTTTVTLVDKCISQRRAFLFNGVV